MEDLRITRLVINNVGVFEHLDLSFEKKRPKDKAEIHIFTGDNGTGKTTLLEALTYFDTQFNTILFNEKNSKLENGKFEPFNLFQKHRINLFAIVEKCNIQIFFKNREIKFNFLTQNNFEQNDLFEKYYKKFDFYTTSIYHTYNFFAYNGHRQLSDTNVEAMKNFEFDPITEALTFDKQNANVNLFQWVANTKTRAALSYMNRNIKNSDKYLALIQKIEKAIGEIIGRKIEFVVDEVTLKVMVKLDDESIHYNTLADGYKSVISWLTDLMFRLDYMPDEGKENFTLFLDEIDIHLHPAAQRRVLPVIQKLFPKAQIFLTTHSPFVIGSVDDAWVYKFKLDEKGNSVLDGEPFLSEDARSYRYILEQVFDIKKQFGIEVEKKLDSFYKLRDETIKNGSSETFIKDLVQIARELSIQSIELQAIIGSELKQLSRILKKEISL